MHDFNEKPRAQQYNQQLQSTPQRALNLQLRLSTERFTAQQRRPGKCSAATDGGRAADNK